jgi:UDP-N-acetylmuramoyl-L-alanyl-D-glutamate--2,6-diaminopimelate ligase
LGKGHEIGQEIDGKKLEFDDRKVLAEAIAGLK